MNIVLTLTEFNFLLFQFFIVCFVQGGGGEVRGEKGARVSLPGGVALGP